MQDPKGATPGFVTQEPSDPTPSSSSFARERLNSLARDVLGDSPTLIAVPPMERVKPYPHQRTMIGSGSAPSRRILESRASFEHGDPPADDRPSPLLCPPREIGLVPPQRNRRSPSAPPSSAVPLPLLGALAWERRSRRSRKKRPRGERDRAPRCAGNAPLSSAKAVLDLKSRSQAIADRPPGEHGHRVHSAGQPAKAAFVGSSRSRCSAGV